MFISNPFLFCYSAGHLLVLSTYILGSKRGAGLLISSTNPCLVSALRCMPEFGSGNIFYGLLFSVSLPLVFVNYVYPGCLESPSHSDLCGDKVILDCPAATKAFRRKPGQSRSFITSPCFFSPFFIFIPDFPFQILLQTLASSGTSLQRCLSTSASSSYVCFRSTSSFTPSP